MSFGSSSGLILKKFETEAEVEDKKRKRQEEWEKVRKPDDPVEAPELPEDNRSLYEKLEEQKLRKQEEYEEQFKLKNQVKGIDEDESKFLEFVADRQDQIHQQRNQEEKQILTEMKDAQVIRVEDTKSAERKVKTSLQSNKKSQMALLAGAVKRKGSEEASSSKKKKVTEAETAAEETPDSDKDAGKSSSSSSQEIRQECQTAQVIGVLPGLGQYDDTSDSESSSSIDSEPDFNLAGNTMGMTLKQIKAHIQEHN